MGYKTVFFTYVWSLTTVSFRTQQATRHSMFNSSENVSTNSYFHLYQAPSAQHFEATYIIFHALCLHIFRWKLLWCLMGCFTSYRTAKMLQNLEFAPTPTISERKTNVKFVHRKFTMIEHTLKVVKPTKRTSLQVMLHNAASQKFHVQLQFTGPYLSDKMPSQYNLMTFVILMSNRK